VGFLDGIVDIERWVAAVQKTPWTMSSLSARGMEFRDHLALRVSASFLAKRLYQDLHDTRAMSVFNGALRRTLTDHWDFSGVGANPSSSLTTITGFGRLPHSE
jgi:hypothetical protein